MGTWRRREFAGLVASGSLGLCPRTSAAAQVSKGRGILLGTFSQDGRSPQRVRGPWQPVDAGRHGVSVIDLESPVLHPRLIPISFNGHGVCTHPSNPRRIVVLEKRGLGGCEIDLALLRITRRIFPRKGWAFYGHGSWSPDGESFYSVESRREDGRGIICIRDGATLATLGTMPSYGDNPHDCRFVADSSVLAITNGGGPTKQSPASVTYVDVRTQQLIRRVPVENQALNAGHLAVGKDGSLLVVSAPRTGLALEQAGGLSLNKPGRGRLRNLRAPAEIMRRLTGEVLSIALDDRRGVAAVTCPAGNLLSFWDFRREQFLSAVTVTYPTGVTLSRDGQVFCVSHEPGASLSLFDAERHNLLPGGHVKGAYLRGAHLVSHQIPRSTPG